MATASLASKSENQKQQQTPTKSASGTTPNLGQQSSPRNTASISTSGTYISFGPVEVSKALQDGEKFVKWDEVSNFCMFTYLFFYLKGLKFLG